MKKRLYMAWMLTMLMSCVPTSENYIQAMMRPEASSSSSSREAERTEAIKQFAIDFIKTVIQPDECARSICSQQIYTRKNNIFARNLCRIFNDTISQCHAVSFDKDITPMLGYIDSAIRNYSYIGSKETPRSFGPIADILYDNMNDRISIFASEIAKSDFFDKTFLAEKKKDIFAYLSESGDVVPNKGERMEITEDDIATIPGRVEITEKLAIDFIRNMIGFLDCTKQVQIPQRCSNFMGRLYEILNDAISKCSESAEPYSDCSASLALHDLYMFFLGEVPTFYGSNQFDLIGKIEKVHGDLNVCISQLALDTAAQETDILFYEALIAEKEVLFIGSKFSTDFMNECQVANTAANQSASPVVNQPANTVAGQIGNILTTAFNKIAFWRK